MSVHDMNNADRGAAFLESQITDRLRVPPHSIEAEQSVLGGLLLSNAAWERIGDMLSEADFYRAEHRILWRTIEQLIEDHKPADALTVAETLKATGNLKAAGGLATIQNLINTTPSAANVRSYAEIIRQRSTQRAVIDIATDLLEEAYLPQSAETFIDAAQGRLLNLNVKKGEREPQGMPAVLLRVMEGIDARHRGQDQHIPTGLVDLDRILHGGLRSGRLYVIAGRPSSGKSALGLQVAIHAALSGHAALVASMEMANDENGERALAAAAKVDLDRVITGKLDENDWDRLGRGVADLNEAPLFFDDSPALSMNQLRARARRMRRKHGIELLLVDYLQLMRPDSKGESRNLEVTEIAEGLKALAKELDIAVIALSQMNRKCEERTNKRGIVSDLRDSGGIDAAADVIAFVYREEMYDEGTPAQGVAEIIVRKARQAKTGTVFALFRGAFARFESVPAGFTPDYRVESTSRRTHQPRKSFAETD